MIAGVGQLEIHLGQDGSSTAWWTELAEQDCLWPSPVGSDGERRSRPEPDVAREKRESFGAESPAPLEELPPGEVSIEQYLEARVQDATRHLEGKVSRHQMAIVRDVLRESMQSDPVIAELVRRAMK